MTGLSTSQDALAAAAKIVREAVKDKSYRSPLGLMVGRYLRWKRFEWGARDATITDYGFRSHTLRSTTPTSN